MEWMILPFKRYADFQGRSRRMEYWMFQVLNVAIAVVLAGPFFFALISASAAAELGGSPDPFEALGTFTLILTGLYGIYALVALIPGIAVTVRRFHDRDMSGWWYLGLALAGAIPFVGFIASIAFLVLMFLPGTDGPNRFGPDPKNPYNEDVFA
ncbi:MAG: DUF805 domain-containing protein [Pseudomonadota bacterium]